jgi:hypothetical protein
MEILKNSKSYLEFIGKDATLLSIAIVVLFIENAFQLNYGRSLINEGTIDLGQLLQFKFLFGFIIFIFVCKSLFIAIWFLFNYILPIHKLDIAVSYKVGFGSFVISFLLFFHAIMTNETNSFLTALPIDSYKSMTIALSLLSLFFATLCDWSGNEKSTIS